MRKLSIPIAALVDAEYEFYTASLKSLSHSHEEKHVTANDDSESEEYLDTLTFSVREARAWFSGRFPHIPSTIINEVLAMFSPQLDIGDKISTSQFLAALRIVIHAERGKKVDRSLAFIPTVPPALPYPVALSQAENENIRFLALHSEFWGNRLDQALTTLPSVMNTDDPRSEHEGDRNDDVLPGDPFLEVFQTRFLVRAEYIRIFDRVKAASNDHSVVAVVTGQPGIGKSIWIYYVLRRCLGEKQPVIWYRYGKFYLFSNAGVQVINPEHLRHPPFTWCFLDAVQADSVPSAVSVQDNQVFPIYVTSPKEERWEKLRQVRTPEVIVMNPWTRGELEKAAVLYPTRTSEEISERFQNAGPSARFCLQYTSKQIADFYRTRDAGIQFDTTQRLVNALLDKNNCLRIGDVSHKICVVRRSDLEGSSPFIVEPISVFIRRRLLVQLWCLRDQDRVDMINRFSRVEGGEGMRGLLFESLYQHRFRRTIEISASPMFRTRDPRSRWHAAFGCFYSAPTLLKSKAEALLTARPPLSLSCSPSETRTYDHSSEMLVIEEDVYYVPSADNEVAIDSFIVHDGHLYMFQFASGPTHSLKAGLQTTLDMLSPLPAPDKQHVIFVVPKRLSSFDCPHSDDGFFRHHIPYVAQVDDS